MPSSLATALSTALSGNGIAGTSGGGSSAIALVLGGLVVGSAAGGVGAHPVDTASTVNAIARDITVEGLTPAR